MMSSQDLIAQKINKRKIRSRAKRISKIKKDKASTSTFVLIKELNLRIQLTDGKTIKQWIIQYCKRNPFKKDLLYSAYNIEIS